MTIKELKGHCDNLDKLDKYISDEQFFVYSAEYIDWCAIQLQGIYLASVLKDKVSKVDLVRPMSAYTIHNLNSRAREDSEDYEDEGLVMDWNYESSSTGFLSFEPLTEFGWSVTYMGDGIKSQIENMEDKELYSHLATTFFNEEQCDGYYGLMFCNERLGKFLNTHSRSVNKRIYQLFALERVCFGYSGYWTPLFNSELFSCPLNHMDIWNKDTYLLTDKAFYYSAIQSDDDGYDNHFISPETYLIAYAINEYMDKIEEKEKRSNVARTGCCSY